MESLAPVLNCLLEIRFALENGESVRTGLSRGIGQASDRFSTRLQAWLFARDQGHHAVPVVGDTPYQRSFTTLLDQGLSGQPIRPQLVELQAEMEQACRDQIEDFIRMLPFKMVLPLLLFQFPAFLLLLLGPLTAELLKGLQ